jgi:hypothetical protein
MPTFCLGLRKARRMGVCWPVWVLLWFAAVPLWAQFPPREEDHFHRRRIAWRIDLQEKLNYPIVRPQGRTYDLDRPGSYPQERGLVRALLEGMQRGRYAAYVPDKFWQTVSWQELMDALRKLNCPNERPPEPDYDDEGRVPGAGSSGSAGSDDGFGDELTFGDLPIADDGGETPPTNPEVSRNPPGILEAAPTTAPTPGSLPALSAECPERRLYDGLEYILALIEEQIFDRNKSSMHYDLQWLCLSWYDPTGTRPEEPLLCFQYKDVLFTLEETMWKNRYNDAECRNAREVFELRRFNGIRTDESGDRMTTLMEAEDRRRRQVEFEHNLWEY